MNWVNALVSVIIGAVAAFIVLYLYDQNNFADPLPSYALAVILGGAVTIVVMWLWDRFMGQGRPAM